MHWYFEALRKYAVFNGRARRREFWTFELGNFLIFVTLIVIGGVSRSSIAANILPALFVLAMVIPSLAGQVRRLHDTNRSGWWIFISLVPLVGAVILWVFLFTDSNPGENRYGPNPKMETANLEAAQMGYLAPPLPPDGR